MQIIRAFFAQSLRYACGGVLGLIVSLAFVQVVLRYGFSASIVWVEEISVLLLLLLCWFGAAQLWLTRSHVAVDLIGRQGPAKKLLNRMIDGFGLVAGAALALFSLDTLQSFSGIEMGSLELDASLRYYPILAGALGIAFAALLNLIAPPDEPASHDPARGGR